MGVQEQRGAGETRDGLALPSLADGLRTSFAEGGELDRYRLLSELFTELADQTRSGANAGAGASAEKLEVLAKQVHKLTEEKATLLDQHATMKADLGHRTRQLEAEQTRAHELEPIIEEQRTRIETLQDGVSQLEARATAKESELHKAHTDNDQLLLKLQRAELSGGDESGMARLEESKRDLARELEEVRGEKEQLRGDKDSELARLTDELAECRSSKADSAGIPFSDLWERLASEKPPLVAGGVMPTKQTAERMVATFIELVRFVDDFDKLVRPFLAKYTKHHPTVKVPWNVYAKRDDARKTIEQVLAPVGGKPVGVVKNRVRGLYRWTEGAMIACDASIESLASELHTFLMGTVGAGSDPNRTIKEFLREDGHELFLQHIRELRGVKLADAFGRGS